MSKTLQTAILNMKTSRHENFAHLKLGFVGNPHILNTMELFKIRKGDYLIFRKFVQLKYNIVRVKVEKKVSQFCTLRDAFRLIRTR